MIKDVLIKEKNINVPRKGWYVELRWMYGDADGYKNIEIGPFPYERKDLFIEFLNTLELMIDEYLNGYKNYKNYDDMPGVYKFFASAYDYSEKNISAEDCRILTNLNPSPRIEYIPDDSFREAELIDFTPFWYDGENLNKYQVEMVV